MSQIEDTADRIAGFMLATIDAPQDERERAMSKLLSGLSDADAEAAVGAADAILRRIAADAAAANEAALRLLTALGQPPSGSKN